MIVPPGPKLATVTKTYNVRACAMSFSDPLDDENLFGDGIELAPSAMIYTMGDTPLPPGQLQINGQSLVSSGVTNDDGAVWGTNSVSAKAGTLVPLIELYTPTMARGMPMRLNAGAASRL